MDIQNQISPQVVLDAENCVCSCGSKFFREAMVLKKISALYSPTGKQQLYPLPVFVCDRCGAIVEEFTSKANYSKIMGEKEVTEENKG